MRAIELAATMFGLKLAVEAMNDAAEIESAIEAFAREANGSLLVMPDPLGESP